MLKLPSITYVFLDMTWLRQSVRMDEFVFIRNLRDLQLSLRKDRLNNSLSSSFWVNSIRKGTEAKTFSVSTDLIKCIHESTFFSGIFPNHFKSLWSFVKNIPQNFCQSSFPSLIHYIPIFISKGNEEVLATNFTLNAPPKCLLHILSSPLRTAKSEIHATQWNYFNLETNKVWWNADDCPQKLLVPS